jgi:hypothetical protein
MAEAFDPYYKWLAIPPDEQPPNHYRLLGVRTFEPDADVIANAADKQMAHIKVFQAGQHSALSQKILNEIAAARVCLLNAGKRAEYDVVLRAQLATKQPVKADRPAPTPSSWQLYAAIAAGAVIVVVIAAVLLSGGRRGKPAQAKLDGLEPVRAIADSPRVDASTPPQPVAAEPAKPAEPTTPMQAEAPKPAPPMLPAAPEGVASTVQPLQQESPTKTAPTPEPAQSATPMPASQTAPISGTAAPGPPSAAALNATTPAKLPVPDESAQAQARKLVQSVYKEKYDKATTPEAQTSLAQDLQRKAWTTGDDASAQYVLFQEAGRLAVSAKSVELALQVVDEMATKFAINALAMKVGVVTTIGKSARLPEQQIKAVVEKALALIEEALVQDQFDTAEQLAEAAIEYAKRSKDTPLRKRAVARNRDLKAEIEELKKYQPAVQQATAVVGQNPNDPAANLTLGRYACFVKGQWDKGLPRLALCGDAVLKDLAAKELQENQASAELAKVADAWWDLGEKESGLPKKHVREHALSLYRQALPGLSGLERDRVEARLKANESSQAEAKKVETVLLFDGKTLKGWRLSDPNAPDCWSVRRGELICVAQRKGAHLITDQKFQDFELHLEFQLTPGANSGVFLRGRYEIQLYDALKPVPADASCGAIFKQIAPTKQVYLGAGKWNTLDATLVGREVTIVMNGEKIIDAKRLSRPTGEALDTSEDQPGPIMLHCMTNEYRFRNLRIRQLKQNPP